MKIERPDWNNIIYKNDGMSQDVALDFWFVENVEPINKILAEGVEVTGYVNQKNRHQYEFVKEWSDGFTPTHKALLINIEPIKKETAEDVLRDFVKEFDSPLNFSNDPKVFELISKAKKVLEKGEL